MPCTPSIKPLRRLFWVAAPTISSRSKTTKPLYTRRLKPSCRVLFFPRDKQTQAERTVLIEEKNRGRNELRGLVTRPIEPAELGLLGASQVARLDKARTNKGSTNATQMWLVTSRPLAELPPLAFLNARRGEWGIENGLHYVLDVSGDEDRRLKVRTLNYLCVLTLLSRISVALWKRGRKKRQSYYLWREHHKARCNWMLHLLCTPPAKVKW